MVGCRPSVILTLFFILFFSIRSFAQTKALDEVTVDLGSGVLGTNGIPFDVPFIIKGDVDPSYWMIRMQYKIKGTRKKWMRFPEDSKDGYSTPVEWKAVPQKEFRLLSGPLHPNVTYVYDFTIYKNVDLDGKIIDKFKEDLMVVIEHTMEDLRKTGEKLDAANVTLNQKMKALFPKGTTILDKELNAFELDLTQYPLKELTDVVTDMNIKEVLDANLYNSIKEYFSSPEYNSIQATLAQISKGTITLSPTDKIAYNAIVDGTNASFKSVKLSDLVTLFGNPANNPVDIILGTATIKESSIAAVKMPDLDAIALMGSFCSKLGQNMKDAAGKSIFSQGAAESMKFLLPGKISDAIESHKNNSSRQEKRDAIIAKFPDILSDKLVAYTVTSYIQSSSDVVSEKNPYIGLDFGFSYAPGYEQLFFYEGVNFYFAPVNKDAPLRNFTSFRDIIGQRLSIHFGITQSLIDVENKRYAPLFKGLNSSLLAGFGVRINRIVRLNYGYVFFYEKDNNPVIDKKHFTAMPQVALTFDLNIAKALGGLGKRIGISQ